MAKFEDFVQKTAETAEVIVDKSAVFAKKAAERAKSVARLAKLKVDIAAEREGIRKNYIQLGKLYYENYKDFPDKVMEQAVADIMRSEEKIDDLRAEIDAIYGSDRCTEAEYEEEEAEAEAEEAEAEAEEAEAEAEEKEE